MLEVIESFLSSNINGQSYTAYNSIIAPTEYQGGLKAGYITYHGEKYAEKILYNNSLYIIGNIFI